MAVKYQAVLWNRQKKIYDRVLWLFILLLLGGFAVLEWLLQPNITVETLIIRGTAFAAIVLLHIVLMIGPLSRLDTRFLPLLYNRRHMGVSMFLMALVHGIFCIIQFHALGDTNPIASVFLSNQNYEQISQFPFQILGLLALVILMLMAVSSHDFWLKNLSPRVWKSLHMLVYVAYALLIGHIALGTLQYEDDLFYKILLGGGCFLIAGLHLFTGMKERKRLKAEADALEREGFYKVGLLGEIEEKRARTIFVDGQNIAVFKYDGKVSAVNNICRHQMGPLGEGKIVEGCITCPWHGYQYLPENGQSPPPFQEKLETYEVRLRGEEVWVNPVPRGEGTFVEPAKINS
jgi:nitrite reductase/ring-hydroxylating ferredoxin subunit/DMSO/TMAO reductase YedYZ heme-binding membrane subunit